jgi:aryl-alcohol dehydrogenase-like predicted oxidoreductase
MNQPSARIALAWVMERAGVSSTLMGVSRPHQIADNIEALDIRLTPDHRARLDAVSASASSRMLYSLFTPALRQQVVFGGSSVRPAL